MNAPERFAEWMSAHEHVDKRFGHVYHYHSRSDAHSKALCQFIVDDLRANCPALAQQLAEHAMVWETNLRFTFSRTGKQKTLDLAIGPPGAGPIGVPVAPLEDVFIACEEKTVMTEHGKSQPRIFDELSSSHKIVHQGDPKTIAAGITVVNVAETFISPLRQTKDQEDLVVSIHKQPDVTQRMVQHLRGLRIRDNVGQVGFDAYATIVVNCDNRGPVTVCTAPPAPQPDDPDHYTTFITRIARFYADRFV